MKQIGAVLAAIAFSFPAFAFDTSMQMKGKDFSEACTRANASWISFCNGYAQAVVDGLREQDGVCIPSGTTRTEIVTITEKAITTVSRLHAVNAYDAVRLVLRRAYPCS